MPYHEPFVPHEWFLVDFQNTDILLPDHSLVHISHDQLRVFISTGTVSKTINEIVNQVIIMRDSDEKLGIDINVRSRTAAGIRLQIHEINKAFGQKIIIHSHIMGKYRLINQQEWDPHTR